MTQTPWSPPIGKITRVWFYSQYGQFNLLSSEKQWQLVLRVWVDNKELVSLGEVDDEDPGLTEWTQPSVVIDTLAEWNRNYIRSTSRQQEYNAKLQWYQDNIKEITYVWANERIEKLQNELADMKTIAKENKPPRRKAK